MQHLAPNLRSFLHFTFWMHSIIGSFSMNDRIWHLQKSFFMYNNGRWRHFFPVCDPFIHLFIHSLCYIGVLRTHSSHLTQSVINLFHARDCKRGDCPYRLTIIISTINYNVIEWITSEFTAFQSAISAIVSQILNDTIPSIIRHFMVAPFCHFN